MRRVEVVGLGAVDRVLDTNDVDGAERMLVELEEAIAGRRGCYGGVEAMASRAVDELMGVG